MTKQEKPSTQRSSTKVPPMMSLRTFLRGGYQDVSEPTVVLSRSQAMFTIVPGQIDEDYSWTPGVASRSTTVPPEFDPRTPIRPTSEIPGWLKPKEPKKAPRTRREGTTHGR